MTAPAIIVDLDGTLADPGDRNLWNFAGILEDKVITHNREFVYRYADDHAILVVTARSEACREDTATWLDRNLYQRWDKLFMTPLGSPDPDWIVKKKIFENEIMGKWDVKVVLEDNPTVAAAYHALGLNVYRTLSIFEDRLL